MSESGGTENTSLRSRIPWIGAVVLAAAATAVLVLSNDARLLRLGLVAALWAAMAGAFAVAHLRQRLAEKDRVVAERQRIYQLELEKEIAARREFEAEAEAQARREVAEEHDAQLKELREELGRLRSVLEQVLGGDVLFERVALRAESTRVRSLAEHGQPRGNVFAQRPEQEALSASGARAVPPAAQAVGRMTAGVPQRPKEPVTQRISPVQQSAVAQSAEPNRPDRANYRTGQQVRSASFAGNVQTGPVQSPARPKSDSSESGELDVEAGAHTAGTSVRELLAAYGATSSGQRRRRRRA